MKFINSISKISKNISVFSEKRLNKIAKEVGFIQRRSKIDGNMFFKLFTFGAFSVDNLSLRSLSDFYERIDSSKEITRQGLENRLEKGSEFLEKVFKNTIEEKYLKIQKMNNIRSLQLFSDIKICDSSIIPVNDELKLIWKGYGNSVPKAALKLQTLYSFKYNSIENVELRCACENDAVYMNDLTKQINENELLLVDLGYFDKQYFNQILNKGAHFLSKAKSNTIFYKENLITNKLEKFDLEGFLKKSINNQIDLYLYTRSKDNEFFEFRIIGEKLPEELYKEKLRRANQNATNQGRTLSKKEKETLKWTIMLTSVDKEFATVEFLMQTYRIRWQIEILFKCWKSFGHIEKVKLAKEYYLKCLIYGRLIMCLLINCAYSNIKYIYKVFKNRDISIIMFYSTIANNLKDICINFSTRKNDIEDILQILNRVARKSLREKRRRKNSEEILFDYALPPTLE